MNSLHNQPPAQGGGPLQKLLAFVMWAVLLVVGAMFSVVVLAIILVVGMAVWAYLWWRTRELRRTMRTQGWAGGQGQVIEGEAVVVRDTEPPGKTIADDPDHPPESRKTRE